MPQRYLGGAPGFDAGYRIILADIGRIWEVRCDEHAARVRVGTTRQSPDVVIGTDAATWIELREGRLSGVDAFSQRRLWVRGDLDLAVGLEGLFRLPDGRRPLLAVHDVQAGRERLSTLTMGTGPDVLLLHGLGGTKASFFETAAALSARYRVHALDLPGFGSSSKPTAAPYTARWMAKTVLSAMDTMGIERARIVGNSMGGRIGLEMGLRAPHRVVGLGLLCPAVVFIHRELAPLARLLRPELAFLPHHISRRMVARQFWSLFANHDLVDPEVDDVMVDEFQRIYGSAAARHAFMTVARNLYLDRPFGREGFYPRLSKLQPPALFVWCARDRLIPPGFRRHVARWLPSAGQIVLEGCGHVPQVERPAQTNGLLQRFFAGIDALAEGAETRRAAA